MEEYPEVFGISAMPPPSEKKKDGQLPDHMIREFFENGYVLVKDFFKREDLEACRNDINGLVEELAQKLYKGGKIKALYNEYGLFERLTKIEEDFPGANVILHKYPRLCESFRNIWASERLLNVVEQLIGPEIAGHPLWNLRTKTPQNEATTVPWHQDAGYLDKSAYNVLQPTAWIPLLDSNANNGCMQVAHGGHRKGRVATHQCCHGGTWYVMLEDDEMERTLGLNMKTDTITCEVPYGSMLLLNNMIPHRSLPNITNQIRWSLDLRWQKPHLPNGFYGLRDGILMRTSKDPNHKVSWDDFDTISTRHKLVAKEKAVDEFDTTIQGPWMDKWEIVHVNRHIDSYRSKSDRPADKM